MAAGVVLRLLPGSAEPVAAPEARRPLEPELVAWIEAMARADVERAHREAAEPRA